MDAHPNLEMIKTLQLILTLTFALTAQYGKILSIPEQLIISLPSITTGYFFGHDEWLHSQWSPLNVYDVHSKPQIEPMNTIHC